MDISNIDKNTFNFIGFAILILFIVLLFGFAIYTIVSSGFKIKKRKVKVKIKVSKEDSDEIESKIIIRDFLKKLEKIYKTTEMVLYKGNRTGEDFIIAIKSKPISNLDLLTIADVAKKQHIYNKIIITSENLYSDPQLAQSLKDYEIEVLSGYNLGLILRGLDPVPETNEISNNIYETAETATNPIQEKTKTYNIIQLFGKK